MLGMFKDGCFSQDEIDGIIDGPRLLNETEFREYFVDGTLDAVAKINCHGGKSGTTPWIVVGESDRYHIVSKTGQLTNSPCSLTNKVGLRPIVKVSSTAFKKIMG